MASMKDLLDTEGNLKIPKEFSERLASLTDDFPELAKASEDLKKQIEATSKAQEIARKKGVVSDKVMEEQAKRLAKSMTALDDALDVVTKVGGHSAAALSSLQDAAEGTTAALADEMDVVKGATTAKQVETKALAVANKQMGVFGKLTRGLNNLRSQEYRQTLANKALLARQRFMFGREGQGDEKNILFTPDAAKNRREMLHEALSSFAEGTMMSSKMGLLKGAVGATSGAILALASKVANSAMRSTGLSTQRMLDFGSTDLGIGGGAIGAQVSRDTTSRNRARVAAAAVLMDAEEAELQLNRIMTETGIRGEELQRLTSRRTIGVLKTSGRAQQTIAEGLQGLAQQFGMTASDVADQYIYLTNTIGKGPVAAFEVLQDVAFDARKIAEGTNVSAGDFLRTLMSVRDGVDDLSVSYSGLSKSLRTGMILAARTGVSYDRTIKAAQGITSALSNYDQGFQIMDVQENMRLAMSDARKQLAEAVATGDKKEEAAAAALVRQLEFANAQSDPLTKARYLKDAGGLTMESVQARNLQKLAERAEQSPFLAAAMLGRGEEGLGLDEAMLLKEFSKQAAAMPGAGMKEILASMEVSQAERDTVTALQEELATRGGADITALGEMSSNAFFGKLEPMFQEFVSGINIVAKEIRKITDPFGDLDLFSDSEVDDQRATAERSIIDQAIKALDVEVARAERKVGIARNAGIDADDFEEEAERLRRDRWFITAREQQQPVGTGPLETSAAAGAIDVLKKRSSLSQLTLTGGTSKYMREIAQTGVVKTLTQADITARQDEQNQDRKSRGLEPLFKRADKAEVISSPPIVHPSGDITLRIPNGVAMITNSMSVVSDRASTMNAGGNPGGG